MGAPQVTRWAGFVRSPAVRTSFVVVALALAVIAIVGSWDSVRPALLALSPPLLAASATTGGLYVFVTMAAWREVMSDLGSKFPLRDASAVFFVSQIGKYVPGGVWNLVAVSELAADRQVPRRRSLAGMAVTLLISIATGLVVAAFGLALAPEGARAQFGVAVWFLPVLVVLLVPAVLNRLISVALRVTRRPPLEHELSTGGTLAAVAWSFVAWLLAGLHLWLLALATGQEASARSFALAAGGYALAWVVGFVVIVVPAGVGAREVVLIAVLAGVLDQGAVLVVTIVSRVLLTAIDLIMAGLGWAALRRSSGRE